MTAYGSASRVKTRFNPPISSVVDISEKVPGSGSREGSQELRQPVRMILVGVFSAVYAGYMCTAQTFFEYIRF